MTHTAENDVPSWGHRAIDSLLGGVFIVAAYAEEIAERVATWADELLIKRANPTRVIPPVKGDR